MPKKIAVLGGGPSAMAAIYYILDAYDWDKDAVDITVYQMGWRLGGKCASGRNMDHNARVEEHGIHFWFGCYHNAFRWIEDCYPRMEEACGYHPYSWQEALYAAPSYVGFTDLHDAWDQWEIKPPAFDMPQDTPVLPKGGRTDFTNYIADYVIMALEHAIQSVKEHNKALKDAKIKIKGISIDADKLLSMIENARDKFNEVASQHNFKKEHPLVAELIKIIAEILKVNGELFHDFMEHHRTIRRIYVIIDLVFVVLNGLIQDDVFHQGFGVINDIDFLAWLEKHGMAEITMENTLVRSYYDGAFAFQKGDKNRPNSEAGTTLMGIWFALLTDDGSMFWKFRGSMGEVVFTPFYLLLKEYGVKFKFFHKVKGLHLTEDKKNIGEIVIGRQATIKSGNELDFDPLVEVKGVKCWPSHPDYSQLVEGEQMEKMRKEDKNVNLESFWTEWEDVEEIRLQAGKDFDEVIFGISIASIPYLCTDLLQASPDWQAMVSKIDTVGTQAVQIWLSRTAGELGWLFPNSTIYTTFAEPLDTWCANPDLVSLEDWPENRAARDVFLFVGSLPDPAQIPPSSFHQYPFIMNQKVRQKFMQYLVNLSPVPFPMVKPSQDSDEWFNWSLLMDPKDRLGMDRLEAQFFRANVDPSERYVLSVADSSKYRMETDKTGFDNLYITGDWIVTPLNSGCFEAAFMAGIQTARAVTGKDITILGEFAFKKHPLPEEA